ncbi:MAG TPA: PAS domain-containing protein, partial [Spirochaetia bacterium]|nr:PAS domain-containing protein [Spirochaetia bacterium]
MSPTTPRQTSPGPAPRRPPPTGTSHDVSSLLAAGSPAAGSLAMVTDASHRVVSCTPALASLLGVDPRDLHGGGMERLMLQVQVRGTSDAASGQVSLRCRVGPPVTLDFSVSPLQRGSPKGMSLVIFSIPDRTSRGATAAHTEVGRDAAHAEALQLIEDDPNPVLRVSRTGVVLYANRASWALLALWRTQVGGRVPADWGTCVHEALESGETVEREVSLGFRTFLLFLVPVGERGCVNVYGLDMTGHKRAEEKVRRSAQVFENVAQAIVVLDTDLRVMSVNEAFCSATGFTEEEILGEVLPDLASDALQAGPGAAIAEAIRDGGRWQGEIVGRRKNGDRYPQWLTLGPVVNPDGRVTEYIAIFADISALK